MVLQNADTAMYHAKASGRNNFQFFRADMAPHAERRLFGETSHCSLLTNDEPPNHEN
jgi:predicted signal transduction protein with EAL and GGDEF domain